jgi:site-specific DNA-methyltransferase (adenine-specific)
VGGRIEIIGAATLILGDALDEMRSLPTGSVDGILQDPPYCSGSVSEASRTQAKRQGVRPERTRFDSWFVGDNMGTAGLAFLLRSVAFEGLRLMTPESSLVTFCDWRMVPTLAPAIESAGLRWQNLLAWDKEVLGMGDGFRAQHEMALHHTTGSPRYHHKGTGNLLSCRRVPRDDREHQTQKPLELLERILQVIMPPGGCILDPFMGSGSTGVAVVKGGGRFIGIERDPEYFETACRRIAGVQPCEPARDAGDLFSVAA